MSRFLIFISLHLFLFLLVIVYQAQANDEEWTIDKYKSLSYARVSGEVIHGDNLNFFIGSHENCEKVYNSFTFVTYEKPGDIHQLLDKNIPIKINGEDLTAKVQSVTPFLMGYRVSFSLGTYPLKEYIYHLSNFYKEESKYEIEIVDGIDFKAAKYFDITANNWKLDKLIPSVLEASELCKTIKHLDS
jgi:hypothetical protein